MAYSALPAKIASDTLTLTNYDAIKDNFALSAPGLATAKGDIVAATAANATARVAVGANASTLVADSAQATGLAWQIQPTCRVYNDANQATTQNDWRTLTFNTERWDSNAMHSVLADTSRLTVPTNGDGMYLVCGNVSLFTSDLAGSDWYHGLRILLNGSAIIAQVGPIQVVADAYDLALQVQALTDRVATDYVELQVFTTAPSLEVALAANFSPEFWAIWQRRG